MTGWQHLDAVLDASSRDGHTPSLWLRDDDATEASPALDRFLALLAPHRVPAVLAVIPAEAKEALARRLLREPGISIVQHGFAHVNHAPEGCKKSELGADRPLRVTLDEVARGRTRLAALFGDRALPLLVPPWNRISAEVARGAIADGLARAVSTFGNGLGRSGLAVVNTDVDIIDWRGGRCGKPHDALAGEVAAAVAASRATGRPVGVLSHHLVHDAAAETFLARLFPALTGRARWLDGREVLAYSVRSRSS